MRSWIIHSNFNKFVLPNDIKFPVYIYIYGFITKDTYRQGVEERGDQKRRKSFVMTQMYCCSLWKLNHVCAARESNRKWCASLSRSSLYYGHISLLGIQKIWRDNIICTCISFRCERNSFFRIHSCSWSFLTDAHDDNTFYREGGNETFDELIT